MKKHVKKILLIFLIILFFNIFWITPKAIQTNPTLKVYIKADLEHTLDLLVKKDNNMIKSTSTKKDVNEEVVDILLNNEYEDEYFPLFLTRYKEEVIDSLPCGEVEGEYIVYSFYIDSNYNTTDFKNIKLVVYNGDKIIISQEIATKNYATIIIYNIEENGLVVTNNGFNIAVQALFALIITFIFELLFLYFFTNENRKQILVTNIVLSIIVAFFVSFANYYDGFYFALLTLVIISLFAMFIKVIVSTITLKQIKIYKRILYGLGCFLITGIINLLVLLVSLL